MSYTETMWKKFEQTVISMYRQGYMVPEIATSLETSEELIAKTIEQYFILQPTIETD